MNNSQKKTLRAIFTVPVPSDLLWSDIESLFRALDATLKEGNGSRIRVQLNGEVSVFHRPHPEREASKGAVGSVRVFLENAGIRYGEEDNVHLQGVRRSRRS